MKKCGLKYIVWLAVAILFLLSGCATPQKKEFAKERIAPNVRTSPVINLLKVKTGDDKVKVIFDAVGKANVIIASSELKEVHHMVVDSEGVKELEVIRSKISPRAIDAAFDDAGHLHVLIDDEHMIKKEGTWQAADRTPWKEVGVNVCNRRFVQGARGLIWAFEVRSKEFGSNWHPAVFPVLPAPPGVIGIPYVYLDLRMVVVPETEPTYTSWTVLDPKEKYVTEYSNIYHISADTRGNVLIVYTLLSEEATISRYVLFEATVRSPNTTTDSATVITFRESRLLHKVFGKEVFGKVPHAEWRQSDLAMDPETGNALYLQGHPDWPFDDSWNEPASWLFHDNLWRGPFRFPLKTIWQPKLAPAGSDCYHAVVIGDAKHVFYLAFTHGVWSAPVDLGQANVSMVQFGSDGKSNALVVWPVKEGIVARWINLLQ